MSTYARGVGPHEPLDAVLRAAAAPAHPEELAGLDAAVAAFRAAAPQPVARRRSLLARVLTVKALVVGAVAASTGVVLAAASGVLPLPRPEPLPPADPPAVTGTASVPAVPPPDGRESPSGRTDDPSKPTVGPRQGADPPCGPCDEHKGKPSKDQDEDQDEDEDQDNSGKGRPGEKGGPHQTTSTTSSTKPPPGGPPPGGPPPSQTPSVEPPPPPEDGQAEAPGSTAYGAVTAVPPSGAEPPSQGG